MAKELAKSSNHWLVSPHITLLAPRTLWNKPSKSYWNLETVLSSYDVSALFTSVPMDPALTIIKDLLEKDNTLKERTVMEISDIILLLEFCLKNTYFSFQDRFYEQVEGAAMGSTSQPHCGQSLHGVLRTKSSRHCPHPPHSGAGMWMTPLSSTRKPTNKASFSTLTVLTLL